MSRIRVLSEQVANQIAAGEVVDRPAAVIKELVENSLDAGATRIDVQVEGGGAGLVRVSDDGEGMDKDDVLLCLERHATSKLREAAGLQEIRSLGFRGEALPSIASVSWLTILSRRREQPLGARAEVRHGALREVREEGCGAGTVMEVRQLFANMPARKKFLKSQRTEIFHMEETVKNLALVHPQVAFSLGVDGRTVLQCPQESLPERMRRIFRYRDALIELGTPPQGAEAADAVHIEGYLLLPEKTPATTAKLRLFVNRRAVQDAMLRHAVRDALQGHLMRGYLPAGMLHLSLSPAEVDVNVHPAKREIRFRNSETVRRLVAASVSAALHEQEQRLRASIFTYNDSTTEERPRHAGSGPIGAAPPVQVGLTSAEPRQPGLNANWEPPPAAPLPIARDEGVFSERETAAQGEGDAGPRQFAGLTLIGQLFSLYLLCERQGQLVVIDQHAAHERILFGRMVQRYLSGQAPGQSLLVPVTVELEPALHEVMEARQQDVAAMGFGIRFFGDSTWIIQEVPALTSALPAETVLREVLSTLRAAPRAATGEQLPPAMEQVFASLACKAAIKAGNRLQPREMLDLLAQMEASAVFSRCPHGRPVLKMFSAAEVEQWFHRHGA